MRDYLNMTVGTVRAKSDFNFATIWKFCLHMKKAKLFMDGKEHSDEYEEEEKSKSITKPTNKRV